MAPRAPHVPSTPPARRPRAAELRIVGRVAEALNSAADVPEALARTLELLAEVLKLETGWVWLLDPESGQFYSAAALNLPPFLQEAVRMTGHSCWCMETFQAGRLTPENIRLIQCSRLYPAVEANDREATRGLSCHASIPLCFQGRPLGIVNVAASAWRELTPDELRLLATVAYQLGIALERARLAEERSRLARAEERARIAREIHDTLAQSLTAIGLQIEGAVSQVRADPDLALQRLERALELTRGSLEEARRSVLELRAAPLAGKPLPEALGALVRAFTSETGIRVSLRVAPEVPPGLPSRVEAELYRIAQEALTNVARHAGVPEAHLSLTYQGGKLRLKVQDRGAGLPETGGRAGLGLAGMRERARLLGGSLRVTNRPGRGLTLIAEAPFTPEVP